MPNVPVAVAPLLMGNARTAHSPSVLVGILSQDAHPSCGDLVAMLRPHSISGVSYSLSSPAADTCAVETVWSAIAFDFAAVVGSAQILAGRSGDIRAAAMEPASLARLGDLFRAASSRIHGDFSIAVDSVGAETAALARSRFVAGIDCYDPEAQPPAGALPPFVHHLFPFVMSCACSCVSCPFRVSRSQHWSRLS